MKLEKPIVYFDLETTGLSTTEDRIVEIYMIKENLDRTEEQFYSRFNPSPVIIPAEAEAIHGISNEDLKDEPKFNEKAEEILKFIEGCDLCGYNIINFDLPMLIEEFIRCKIIFNHRNYRIFDSYKIWMYYEPRNLNGASRRFLKEDIVEAHRAKNDVAATKRIFHEQYNQLFSEDTLTETFHKSTELDKKLDLSGKFMKTEEGSIILTFGKYSDKTVNEVFSVDPSYFKWIFEKSNMSGDTKMIANKIYQKLSQK